MFRLGNKSETYNTPYNLGDGAFFNNSAGFRTYSAHTFTGSNITGYGTYGGNATSNYGSKLTSAKILQKVVQMVALTLTY